MFSDAGNFCFGQPDGVYEHPLHDVGYCQCFYICAQGYANLQTCAGGTQYNPASQTCDWPHNIAEEDICEPVADCSV